MKVRTGGDRCRSIMSAPPKITHSAPAAFNETDGMVNGIFEPSNGFVLGALARNKLTICLAAVVLAAIGLGYGLSRHRTFTSSATLQVGQVNPNSPGFYSYVASAGALATAFSRSVSSEPVLATVQQKLGLTPALANERLSAAPVPQSPVFRVIATGPTASATITLANVAANAVIAYESQANSANPQAASLLKEYGAASLALERAKAKLAEFESSIRSSAKRGVSVHSSVFAGDKAAVDTALARLKAIDSAYTAAVTSQAPRTGLVSLLAGATSASNDRKSKVEMYGFIGLLAGIVVGCLLAVLRERRRSAGMGVKVQEPARG